MLTTETTVLVVVDVQGNLAHAMHEKETLFEHLATLIQGARILNIPIIVTEQYPKGLGPTIPEIASLLPDSEPISKVAFSCCGEAQFMQTLEASGRNQVLIAGIETHVCVYQTTCDLLSRGYEVDVVADAVSSRSARNREIGLAKMRDRGAALSCVEMALYELMKEAGGETFKAVLKVVK